LPKPKDAASSAGKDLSIMAEKRCNYGLGAQCGEGIDENESFYRLRKMVEGMQKRYG
jgi:hypothetical protein